MKTKGLGIYFAFMAIIVVIMLWTTRNQYDVNNYTYPQFLADIEESRVTSVTIRQNGSGETPTGELVIDFGSGARENLYVPDVKDVIADLDRLGMKNYYVTDVQRDSVFLTTIFPILIGVVVLMVFFAYMNNQASGGGNSRVMNFGKSRARMVVDTVKRISFKNVAGLDEEKEELKEIVDFLKNPKKYLMVGARIPKGVLLVGPPGTGKTLLARAVAGEAGVPFFSISGSDFVEMFVGVGASRVRDLFEEAKKNSPCIVFIDEIDAVARRRGTGMGGGHDEREQTLNQLLVEMDGFSANEGIIVMSATNRVDILDPAILRPGRFDRKVMVGRPDVRGR